METEKKHIKILDNIAEWSLYTLIFVLPFSKSLIEVTIAAALAAVIIKKMFLRERLFDRSVINIILCVFLLASLASIFNSQYISLSVRAFFAKILKFAALFLIAKEIMNTREKLARFTIIAAASCALILFDGFVQYFFLHADLLHAYPAFNFVWTNPSFLGAPTASFPFPNDFAAWILVFIFPAGAYLFFGKKEWLKTSFSAMIFAALFYFLILTKVRGAWLSFIGALGCLAFLKPRTIGVILLIVLLLGGGLAYKKMVPYAVSLTSVNTREAMWQTGWKIFKEHPILGNGVNTFFNKFKMARQDEDRGKRGSYAHNCYLQMACDTGLLGLLSFLAFAAAVLLKSFLSLRSAKDVFLYSLILGISLGLAAFLLHSAVDTDLYSLPLAALFWLSAGVLLSAVKLSESAA